jgi:hypothetical protein
MPIASRVARVYDHTCADGLAVLEGCSRSSTRDWRRSFILRSNSCNAVGTLRGKENDRPFDP